LAAGARISIRFGMSKVNEGTALAIGDLISRMRQGDENLWEMIVDEGGCMINVLELDERPTFSLNKR
jgi:hypothetical protein